MLDPVVTKFIRELAEDCFLPPRFLYARRAGDRACLRRRLRPVRQPWEHLLFHDLRCLGFCLEVWSPREP